MQIHRRFILLFLGTLLLVGMGLSVGVAAESGKKLVIENVTEYKIPAEGSVVNVIADVHIANRDPSTEKRAIGTYYFYTSIGLPISRSAKGIKIIRGDGKQLKFDRQKTNDGYDILDVQFGRRLHYNNGLDLQLKYDLLGTKNAPDYISPSTIHFQAHLLGDSGTVSAVVPDGFDVELESYECDLIYGRDKKRVSCPQLTGFGTLAFTLEAHRSTQAFEYVTEPIAMQGNDITLHVAYHEGEEAWANKVVKILTKSLPVLETIMGFPYGGPSALTIRQDRSSELEGYEGTYQDGENEIALGYGAPRETIIHEGAHLWSAPFADRWLVEGWAEWSAREALRRLNLSAEVANVPFKQIEPMDLPLRQWTFLDSINSEKDEELTAYGYAKSTRFISQLVKNVGLKQMQQVNRQFLPKGGRYVAPATTANYYDVLESSGANFQKLWETYVEK